MAERKITEAYSRIFNRVFVCMKCNSKIRADLQKVFAGKVKCRKCRSKALRPKSRERRG